MLLSSPPTFPIVVYLCRITDTEAERTDTMIALNDAEEDLSKKTAGNKVTTGTSIPCGICFVSTLFYGSNSTY